MNSKQANGTDIRTTPAGFIATRGNRELYISAKSIAEVELARDLLARYSFDRLHKAGTKSRLTGARVSHISTARILARQAKAAA